MAQSIEQLSFGLTTNELAEQERALAGLRACAGTVVAAASVAGSFLAGRGGRGALDAWGILAVTSFVLCLAGAIWVLLPHAFVFAFRGETLLAESDEGTHAEQVTEAYRAAGAWIEPHVQANRRKIAMLADWLTLSCVLLAVEVVSWILSLTS